MSISYYLQDAFSNGQLEQEKIEQIEKAIVAFNNNQVFDYLIEIDSPRVGTSNPDNIYYLMLHLNQVIMGHGIEAITDHDVANAFYDSVDAVKYGNCIGDYINCGDTYNTTILYDRIFDRLLVTTMGDYLEEIDRIKAIATEIENLVASGVIQWDEWDDKSFPLRLQKCEGNLQLFYGSPDFDSTHAGAWGYYEIQEGNTEYLAYAIDMYDQCLGMENQTNNQ